MDHQLFFPQAYGTDVNYWPFLDLSADNLSDKGHILGIQDKRYSFRLMGRDVYWKQDRGLRVLPWLPSNFYLIPSPFVGSSGGEAWCGFQNFHNSGRTYWVLLFSSLWGTHLAVWDLILSRCYHLAAALSLCSFFLSLDVVYLFWWVPESSSDGCWTTSLMLVFSQEEISACPSILPFWTRSLNLFSSLFFTSLCVYCLRIYFLGLSYFLFLPFFLSLLFLNFSFTGCFSFRNL